VLPRTIGDMDPFIGSEAVAGGVLTRGQLRWNYTAVHPNVYVAKGQGRTLESDALAAWLWSGRRGIVAGRAAAGLYGVLSVGESSPVELIADHSRRRPGVIVRRERIGDDEVRSFG
jgi:hypothetical protein